MRLHRATLLAFCGPFLFLISAATHSQTTPQFDSLLASAQQAQARGDFLSAAGLYQQAAKLRPEIPELRANAGLMYFQAGEDQQAIEAFREVIKLKPALIAPKLFLGLEYVKLKRYKDAIPLLKSAAAANSKDIQVQVGLGKAYLGAGDARSAIASYQRATELDPKNADLWYHLGITYLEQVEADARILLTRYKDSGPLQALMGDTFAEQRALTQADEAYKKALTLSSLPFGTHANYGFTLLDRHDSAGGEREFKSELATDPGSLMAKLGLARLQTEQEDFELAADTIEQIWNTDPGFSVSNARRFALGLAQTKRSDLQRALEARRAGGSVPEEMMALFQIETPDAGAASGVLPADPSNVGSSSKTGAANPFKLRAAGRYRQCSDLLSPRLPSLPAQELRKLVFCAYSTGDYQHAFAAAKTMVVSSGSEAEGVYWEVRSSQKLAAESLARASALDSSSSKLHVLLGDIYRQRKNTTDAEREYRTALAIQSTDAGAMFGLSLTLLATQRTDEAFQIAQAALSKNADDPEFNAVMGEILCAKHDYSAAEPYLKKALNAKPEYVPHVHGLLARVYARTGRTQGAIAELKLALSNDKDGSLNYQIGRLYLKVGDRNAATRAFESSKQIRDQNLSRAEVGMQQGEEDPSSP